MPNAKDFNPCAHGLVTSIVGPSGGGKSHAAASAVRWALEQGRKAFAFLSPVAELSSYAGLDLEWEPLVDEDFDSVAHVQQGKTMVSKTLVFHDAKLAELAKRDDIAVLIYDTANAGLSAAVRNAVLASQGIARPQEGKNVWSPYQIYPLWMEERLNKIDLLRYRKKMHVIYLWHQAMKEMSGFGRMRKEIGADGKLGVRWDDAIQAEVFGQAFAQVIPRYSDLFFFAEDVLDAKDAKGNRVKRCRLLAMPDELRLPKTRLPGVMARFAAMPEIPNDFSVLLKIVEECYKP